jgi:hypothetical protein
MACSPGFRDVSDVLNSLNLGGCKRLAVMILTLQDLDCKMRDDEG